MKYNVLLILPVLILSLSCQRKPMDVNNANLVQAQSPTLKKGIGDEKTSFMILAKQRFADEVSVNSIKPIQSKEAKIFLKTLSLTQTVPPAQGDVPENTTAAKSSLILGYPIDLLYQQSVFGGVIIGVSNTEDANLGGLKLSDLPPTHVVSAIDQKTNKLVFLGCEINCTESSEQKVILQIPILGVDPKAGLIYLDMSTLGTQLDIVQKMDPSGEGSGLLHKSSDLVLFDFSLNTLVFDVASVMTIKSDAATPTPTEVKITTRWYLKLSSGFNPAFVAREQTEGVGFFSTARSARPFITRFSTTPNHTNSITKYYVKSVPERYRKSFAESFQAWNKKFQESIHHDMFEFEFLETQDPRFSLIVTGDIRYNVIEWDLVNQASYGGLGPSIANQFTGEIFNANVLIQGPRIEEIYKAWFQVSDQIKELKRIGKPELAEQKLAAYHRQMNHLLNKTPKTHHVIHLGKTLQFHISSEDPRHQDPLVPQLNFDNSPAGFSYDTYMDGYFIDMVSHELGHNIGLRHNFRGNLGTNDSMQTGTVSRSAMEYLERQYRHLDRLGEYDSMAIDYGYAGKLPEHKDWYCTDEDQVSPTTSKNSAECSNADASSDPFSYFEERLDKSIAYLTAKNSPEAPIWKVTDVERQLDLSLNGLASYAVSAPFTSLHWTNFAGKWDRPTDGQQISQFVLSRLSAQVCSPLFPGIIAAKTTEEAKKKTQENIAALQEFFKKIATSYQESVNIFTSEQFPCLAK